MKRDEWLAVLARIVPFGPEDLDAPTSAKPPPVPAGPAGAAPSAHLWDRPAAAWSCMGVRVTRPAEDAATIAARLASAALERGVMPVILSTVPRSGFEQFGFRVEHLPAEPEEERARAEAELARFWDLTIIIDLDDIARLA